MTFMLAFAVAIPIAAIGALTASSLIGGRRYEATLVGKRIGCVDGLRGFLALSVVAHHFYLWTNVTRLGGMWERPSINVLNQLGAGAVALFFMTTGLVFYPVVLRGFHGTEWKTVYISRAFRILPLIMVSVIVITLIQAFRPEAMFDASYFGSVVQWLTAWDEPDLLRVRDSWMLNAHVLWSLWHEWVFYVLLLPLCAVALDAVRSRRFPTWIVPVGFISLAVLAKGATTIVPWQVIRNVPLKYLPLFGAGMIAYELQMRDRFRRILSSGVAGLLAGSALLLGMIVAPDPYSLAYPLFAFFFVCVACGNSLGGLLTTRGALVLGDSSYGIYLLHGIVLALVFQNGRQAIAFVPTTYLPVILPILAVIVSVLAFSSYHLIERPAIKLGKALASRRALPTDLPQLTVAP